MSALSLEQAYAAWASDLVRYAAVLVDPTDAADIVADAFADLVRDDRGWQHANDQRRFLFGVVANKARLFHRGRARRLHRQQVAVRRRNATAPDNGHLRVADRDVLDALGGLSVQQRATVFLAYWEDLSVADIAPVLDIADGTVRRHLARFRTHLREVLTDDR